MTIEQTVEIPADYHVLLELPRSIPVGTKAQVHIDIPAISALSPDLLCKPGSETLNGPARSFRGILKGKGITLERFREIQREDKALEDEADTRLYNGIR
jgi:hypothetical protein